MIETPEQVAQRLLEFLDDEIARLDGEEALAALGILEAEIKHRCTAIPEWWIARQ